MTEQTSARNMGWRSEDGALGRTLTGDCPFYSLFLLRRCEPRPLLVSRNVLWLSRLTIVGAVDRMQGYRSWLLRLQELAVVDAGRLKPLVDGKRIMKEVGRGPGPWLTEAFETLMRWQLRNPVSNDANKAMQELKDKYTV